MLNDQSIILRTCTRDGGVVRLHVKESYFLPHLSGLPHLPGVPHFHVNRSSVCQKNNLSCASLFVCTFLCRHYMTLTSNCLISRFWPFCFAELRYSLSEFNSSKICQHFTKWTRWNKRDQVRSSANSLFKLPSTHFLLLRVSILNVYAVSLSKYITTCSC